MNLPLPHLESQPVVRFGSVPGVEVGGRTPLERDDVGLNRMGISKLAEV